MFEYVILLAILLDPNFTLRDQSVPTDAVLQLMKRGDGDSKTEGTIFMIFH